MILFKLDALGALGERVEIFLSDLQNYQELQREYRELQPRALNDLWREHRKLLPTVLRVIVESFRSMLSSSLAESPREELPQGARPVFNDELNIVLHVCSIGKYYCCVNMFGGSSPQSSVIESTHFDFKTHELIFFRLQIWSLVLHDVDQQLIFQPRHRDGEINNGDLQR